MEKEMEVKILNVDLKIMEEKLNLIGAEFISDEVQKNILIDSSKNPIANITPGYLRIREINSADKSHTVELTFKKKIQDTNLRKYEEHSIFISSVEGCVDILKYIGFDKIDVEEKHRRSYVFNGARFDLDVWTSFSPVLSYMEIEVCDENQLEYLIELLEINRDDISLLSIADLKSSD